MTDDPYKYFRVEAREIVDELVRGVLALEKGEATPDMVRGLLRHVHTLKGAARVVRQREIADDAHAIEEALAPLREDAANIHREQLDEVLRLVDDIQQRIPTLESPAASVSVTQTAGAAEEPLSFRADAVEIDALLDAVGEAHTVLGSLANVAKRVTDANGLIEQIIEQISAAATGRHSEVTEHGAHVTTSAAAVELRRVLSVVDRDLGADVEELGRELRQVRTAAERVRLVPVGMLFTSLERAARDVAAAQGKQVRFIANGGDLRLDAQVVATAQAALQQIVRNAVAHGIEAPAERASAGKATEGGVTIDVTRQGPRAVFRCRDDGRGIDLDAVRIALQRRGAGADETRALTPDALLRRLLAGGVTTSVTVTEVAGRGIGLDIARNAAERLGGNLTATTEAGNGTTIELAVPLAVASLELLVVECNGQVATIPLDGVRSTVRVAAREITSTSDGDALVSDGTVVPFVALPHLLEQPGAPAPRRAEWSAAILTDGEHDVALGVHRVVGIETAVIRPLPELVPYTSLVAGASIDAEGNVQLSLDPNALVAQARNREPAGLEREDAPQSVLVVDDSLTTRMLEQSILETAGYDVDVASSGEEAMAKAYTKPYALFLVDVEMPGMDGFTFVERTRADAVLNIVPCILITSRASAEDRRRGADAGARAYIAKGEFDQAHLLACIRDLVAS